MVSAVIFDMDGLLIDSEPIWRRAEVRIFGSLGVPLTEDLCAQTMGLRLDEVVKYWHERHPWECFDADAVCEEILDEMERQLSRHAQPMPGVNEVIDFFEERSLKLALATSSYLRLVDVVLRELGLANTFEAVRSAQFEKRGKPQPDVFLSTARELGVEPANCLVFEDSPFGVQAAKNAGMLCVAVPEEMNMQNSTVHQADLVLRSLREFDETHWRTLNGG